MPVENLNESYFDRCVSATNLYVEAYNKNMQSEIANGVCLPLDKEFKRDRFRSMTGQEWLESYDNVVRLDKIEHVERTLSNYYERMVSETDQGRIADAGRAC